MNQSKFKIHGTKRKKLKRKLAELKSLVENFWYYHQLDKDMCVIYPSIWKNEYPMNDVKVQERYDSFNAEIKRLEELLSEPYA